SQDGVRAQLPVRGPGQGSSRAGVRGLRGGRLDLAPPGSGSGGGGRGGMRARRVTGILSLLAVVAAAMLAGVTVGFFSSGRTNSNQFLASPDFSATPPQGSSHLWSGFADFSVGLSDTLPVATGTGTVLQLAHRDPDQVAQPVSGALSPTVGAALAQTFTPGADH